MWCFCCLGWVVAGTSRRGFIVTIRKLLYLYDYLYVVLKMFKRIYISLSLRLHPVCILSLVDFHAHVHEQRRCLATGFAGLPFGLQPGPGLRGGEVLHGR